MSKEKIISNLLNGVWYEFMDNESEIIETNEGQIIKDPPEEEQKYFTTLLQACQKDMRDTHNWRIPQDLVYWRHPAGDNFFTVGWLDENECVTAFYTIDVEEDVCKRWPKEPTHFQMFKP